MFGVIEKVFPDSCYPMSLEQLERAAAPYFKLISHNNGRLDYVVTTEEFRRRVRRLTLKKAPVYAKLLLQAFRERDLRYKLELLRFPYYSECFRLNLMDHERMLFERR
jgi:cyclopropane-fatty-acyl-phospholipid synthase